MGFQLIKRATGIERKGVADAIDSLRDFSIVTHRVIRTEDGVAIYRVPAALMAMRMEDESTLQERQARCFELIRAEGYVIDLPVDAWQWDPYKQMLQRAVYGYGWVPSAGMKPIQLAPGISMPGNGGFETHDPDNPPVGAIIVPPLDWFTGTKVLGTGTAQGQLS